MSCKSLHSRITNTKRDTKKVLNTKASADPKKKFGLIETFLHIFWSMYAKHTMAITKNNPKV